MGEILLTTGQVAVLLGVSRERVLELIRDGRLRVAHLNGFGHRLLRRKAVEDLVKQRHQQQEKRRAAVTRELVAPR